MTDREVNPGPLPYRSMCVCECRRGPKPWHCEHEWDDELGSETQCVRCGATRRDHEIQMLR